MTQPPTTLPPLRISLLSDVPNLNISSTQNICEEKIKWALRYLHEFEKRQDPTPYENYTIQVYKSKATAPSLARGFEDDDSADEEPKQSPEYLTFLFDRTRGSDVFVLSTSKAFKAIRPFCSHEFSVQCYNYYAQQLNSIEIVASKQIFSPISESIFSLKGELPHKADQETRIYRHCRAILRSLPGIEGSDVKIEFKERAILIYRDLTLSQYARLLKQLPLTRNTLALNFAGLPANSLETIQNLNDLDTLSKISTAYIAGFYYYSNFSQQGWKFNLEISDKWCSKGYKFRLCWFGRDSAFPFTDTEKDRSLKLMDVWNWLNSPGHNINPEEIFTGSLSLEYKTISNQWYTMPLIDCIEGWVTSPDGRHFFKVDRAWYYVKKTFKESLDNSFADLLSKKDLVLKPGEKGYLNRPWEVTISETVYNRSYTTNTQYPLKWYDGNQKRDCNFELFDILQIDGNDVFIYHVKKEFNTELKKEGAQLVSSAQIIQSCRIRTHNNPDLIKLNDYCNRVGGSSANVLLDALLHSRLHFVLAFRVIGEPFNAMKGSNSLSAKYETIRAYEAISSLNNEFQFHISPIQQITKEAIFVPNFGSLEIVFNDNQYFVNTFPANWDGNFFIWTENNNDRFAVNRTGLLYKFDPHLIHWLCLR